MTEDEFRHNGALEYFKSSLAHHTALSGALVSFIQTAIRIAFLLNGGAIVAALTVYGAKAGGLSASKISLFGIAIGWWITGLLFATFAVLLIGWAQRQFQAAAGREIKLQAQKCFGVDVDPGKTPKVGLGQTLRGFAIVSCLFSLVAFAWGAYEAIPAALVR